MGGRTEGICRTGMGLSLGGLEEAFGKGAKEDGRAVQDNRIAAQPGIK